MGGGEWQELPDPSVSWTKSFYLFSVHHIDYPFALGVVTNAIESGLLDLEKNFVNEQFDCKN